MVLRFKVLRLWGLRLDVRGRWLDNLGFLCLRFKAFKAI